MKKDFETIFTNINDLTYEEWLGNYENYIKSIKKAIENIKFNSTTFSKKPLYKYSKLENCYISNLKKNTLFLSRVITFSDKNDCKAILNPYNIIERSLMRTHGYQTNQVREWFDIQSTSPLKIMEELEMIYTLKPNHKNWNNLKPLIEELNININKIHSSIEQRANRLQQYTFTTCFCEVNNSEKMWNEYADDEKGFCIEYDLESFNKEKYHNYDEINRFSSEDVGNISFITPVVYRNKIFDATKYLCDSDTIENKGLNILISYFAVSTKLKEYKEEKEWRLNITYTDDKFKELKQKNLKGIYKIQEQVGFKAKCIYLGRKFDFNSKNGKRLIQLCRAKQIPVYMMDTYFREIKLEKI